ncbi:hypothetical protein FY034_06790 [Trichlorobacter lovleyi]|uniref:hypothetical protein n=1 Tax=Trichlorobacter lovleyi TaxID=313985 RepID=UPI00223F98B9|nr:hypothetical protein [Trichlorobacter lovleyi]QOX78641.1 hypothetical protein FY034_06790 [Trichlorobacter lovleyi]
MPRKKAPDSVKQARVNEAANVLYGETGDIPKVDDVAHKAKMSSRDIKDFFNEWKANQMAAASTCRLSQDAQDGLDKLRADAEQVLKVQVAWLMKDHEAALLELRGQYMTDLQKEAEAFDDTVAEFETRIDHLNNQLHEYKTENIKLKAELAQAQALNISKDILTDILQKIKQPQAQPDAAAGEENKNAAA